MKNCYKLLLLWVITLAANSARADEFIVSSSLDDGNPHTLREAIQSAEDNPGADTVFIDVAGMIDLGSTLEITDEDLTIIGPYAQHLTLSSTTPFTGPLVFISGSGNVLIRGLGFEAGDWDGSFIEIISAVDDITVSRCHFEGNNTSSNGGAIRANTASDASAVLNLNSCSFMDNTAASGGSVYVVGMDADISNCTFSGNTGDAGVGGGIHVFTNPGEVMIRHCTFRFNTDIGGGTALHLSFGATVRILNNIFDSNGSVADQQVMEGSGTLISDGGNVYNQLTFGEGGGLPWDALDNVGLGLAHGLLSLKTDGYGMEYYPIGLGVCVDFAAPTPGGYVGLQKDARLAPRALDTGGGLIADAGAVEYTPMQVTTDSDGAFGSLAWCMDPINWPGTTPIYIEFANMGFAPLTNPTYDGELTISETVIIDGYSNPYSIIPGPEFEGVDGVNPGRMGFIVSDAGPSTNGIIFSATSTNSRVSGGEFRGFDGFGFRMNGDNNTIAGNLIGISHTNTIYANGTGGIAVEGIDCNIGGYDHWTRNVVSANGTGGADRANIWVQASADGTRIMGNFIGTITEGDVDPISAPTDRGILVDGISTEIGDAGYGNRNLISNNNEAGIFHRISGQLTEIYNNYVGLDYEGTDVIPNDYGILLEAGNTVTIGDVDNRKRNIISGNDFFNIRIQDPSNVDVVNNWIGPDSSGNTYPGSLQYRTPVGIWINGPVTASNIDIGIPDVNGGNLISGCQQGIEVVQVSVPDGLRIQHNAIGFQKDGSGDFGNRDFGIHLGTSLTNSIIIGDGVANAIGWTTDAGGSGFGVGLQIFGNGTSDNHTINSNLIGLNVAGDAAAPNRTGVRLEGCANLTLGADFGSGDENYISGNSGYGIEVTNGSNNTTLRGNVVGLMAGGIDPEPNTGGGILVNDGSLNTVIGGGSTDRNVISGNDAGGLPIAGIQCEGSGVDGMETIISANYIGVDISGDPEVPNFYGIAVYGTHEAIIGGTEGNYISGNEDAGVYVATDDETVEIFGNVIGLNVSSVATPNNIGILLDAPVTVGGSIGNQIAGNDLHGIQINNSGSYSTIDNNDIGNNGAGATGIENGQYGIYVNNSEGNVIGDPAGSGNRIGGNLFGGLHLTGTSSTGNVIQANTFYDPSEATNINPIGIILSSSADGNTIGGQYGVEGNDISRSINEGIYIEASHGNTIQGNTIGNDGSVANSNNIGIRINSGNNTLIGGDNPSGTGDTYNVISGNDDEGIQLDGALNTQIYGNFIGVDVTGTAGLPNGTSGIVVLGASSGTQIGSNASNNANTIAANTDHGIWSESAGISIRGNYIGLAYLGTSTPTSGTQAVGIHCQSSAGSTVIGGSFLTEANFIANNSIAGIRLLSGDNEIYGNMIGLGVDSSALGSQDIGIQLLGSLAIGNVIGTNPRPDSGNTIMNNTSYGVYLNDGAAANLITGNSIGCWDDGTNSGDQDIGVRLYGAGIGNNIGAAALGYGNIISLNDESGIQIDSTDFTTVVNNQIGSYFIGFLDAPNGVNGIDISNYASNNTIGGGGGFTANTISSNINQNVLIDGVNTIDNDISGNIIGLAFTDSAGLAPSEHGILVQNGANGNLLGKTSTGNIIGAATIAGIQIDNADDNFVQANWVGITGSCYDGVLITNGSAGNLVGGTGTERNIISRNDNYGVGIINSDGNRVLGNYIGTGIFGADTLPNNIGIYLSDANLTGIGGNGAGEDNTISNNTLYNIYMESCTADTIRNNNIGSNGTGNDTITFSSQPYGIYAENSTDCIIGGDRTNDEGNIFLDNETAGVLLDNCSGFSIYGNQVGVTRNGFAYYGNQQGIVLSNGSNDNAVGATGNRDNRITANYTGVIIDDSEGNAVQANWIGLNSFGGAMVPTLKQHYGVLLGNGATGNLIGGDGSADRNFIGSNDSAGVVMLDVEGNRLEGNWIGLNFFGGDTIPNGIGVYVEGGTGNRIGAPETNHYNIITGNATGGIYLNGSSGDTIQSNFFGTIWTGLDTVDNSDQLAGIYAEGCSDIYIGGDRFLNEGNIVLNQDSIGIVLDNSSDCEVHGNNLGVSTLDAAMGNTFWGLAIINGSSGNNVGREVDGYNNVISYNQGGIIIQDGHLDTISNNYIGTNLNGDGVVASAGGDQQFTGITITGGSTSNVVNGKNIISGNVQEAININGTGTEDNHVLNNIIGLDATGMFEVPNEEGVIIESGASNNRIGGPGAGRNVIAGNSLSSVVMFDAGTEGNIVSGNLIGMYADSSALADPTLFGIGCLNGAENNYLGENVPGGFNRIVGADSTAVYLGNGANNNSVVNNQIGLLPDGSAPSSLTQVAVYITNSNNNIIGGVGALMGNEIAHTVHGIELENNSPDNSIIGNSIHDVDEIGIDIDGDTEIEVNDSLTVAGANNVEIDRPILQEAYSCVAGENTRVGYLVTVPEGFDYVMEFFLADGVVGESGDGEFFVGRDTISVTVLGEQFSSELDVELASSDVLTATITRLAGSTSEFAENMELGVAPPNLGDVIPITTADSVYCPGDAIAALYIETADAVWYDDYPSNVIGLDTPFVPTLNPGRNWIYATASTVTGCETPPDSIVLILSDTSVMYAIDDQSICIGAQLQLDAFGGETYVWEDNPDLSELGIPNPLASPSAEGTYYVTITDSLGCVKQDEVNVSYLPRDSCALEHYAAFTPNGDGINDTFWIDGIEGWDNATVYIYNRWGDKMRTIPDYDNTSSAWDGTKSNGNRVQTGTYYFVVDVGSKEDNFAGWVQVMY